MKSKYILIASLILIFCSAIKAANTYTINQNFTISLTTGYVNNMSETWNVVSTETDKPIIISYTIGTENNYDWLTINNVDNSGNVTSQLLRICGTKSGIISTTAPNGRVQVVFTSDVSVCYASNPSVYSGINVTFSTNPNQIVGNGLFVNGNSYISGNVGIGKSTPQALLDVSGSLGGLAVTGANIDSYYSNKLLQFQNSAKLILGWNYSGGRGEQAFIANSNPVLAGGFSFYNYPYNGSSAAHLMTIEGNGKVGIGIPTPLEKLTVAGGHGDTKIRLFSTGNESDMPANLSLWASEPGWTYYGTGIGYNVNGSPNYGRIDNARGSSYIRFLPGETKFQFQNTSGVNIEALTIKESGKIGIGISNITTDALLTVNGIIHAKEIKVSLENLADYVFSPEYKLMPLFEVEKFVKTNRHLPEIPSAVDVKENGLSMGEMQNKLLQKIEELTLYVIEQGKRIEQLEKNQK